MPDEMPRRQTLEVALYLALRRGVIDKQELRDWIGAAFPTGSTRPIKLRAQRLLAPLRADGVLVEVDGTYYVPNLADLVAWAADGYAAREDADVADDPIVPLPGETAVKRSAPQWSVSAGGGSVGSVADHSGGAP